LITNYNLSYLFKLYNCTNTTTNNVWNFEQNYNRSLFLIKKFYTADSWLESWLFQPFNKIEKCTLRLHLKWILCRFLSFSTISILERFYTYRLYTFRECTNRFIYFVLRCWYFYNPVAVLLLFQFSFLILKTRCSIHTSVDTRKI